MKQKLNSGNLDKLQAPKKKNSKGKAKVSPKKNELHGKKESSLDREFNPDKTKDMILKESLKIISLNGVNALSLREVARNLGISHGTPYRHFSTKEDVLTELGVIGFRLFTKTLESNLPIPTTKEILLQRFRKLKENYIEFATTYPELYNIIFNTKLPEKDESTELKIVAQESFSVLVNQVAALKTAGLLDTEDVFSASMLIFTQLHGHIMLQNTGVVDGLLKGFDYKKDIMIEINNHLGKILQLTKTNS